ncbi:MAG TPA: hypothetical protein VGR25_03685 [bacterium]|nr:hypothetical protein [bacterium]
MKHFAVLTLALLILATPAAAQATRVIAVVDFADETADGRLISASQLSGELGRLLAERAGGRFRVLPVEQVRAAMAARNLGPRDLFGPNQQIELAAAVGADWIVTGRWMHLDTDVEVIERAPLPPIVHRSAAAVLEIRVLEASTRRVLLNDSFMGQSFLVRFAAYQALWRAAEAIARL